MKDTYDATADVATVLAIEEPTKALLKAIKAVQPAINRLGRAGYPGMDHTTGWVSDALGGAGALDADDMGTVAGIADALEMLRTAAGRQDAWGFEWWVKYFHQSVHEAAKAMIDGAGASDENLDRVNAMRQYAATATR